MTGALAIAGREFASFFRASTGWLVCALFLLLAGVVFAFGALRPGEPATMRDFFTLSNWLLMFVCPAISMRLIAEERRTGTLEPLLAAPVSDFAVVAGKYAGAVAFLAAMLGCTLVFPLTLRALSEAPLGPIVAGYAGLALLGAFYLAIGALCSALTGSQVSAFLAALFALLLLRIVSAQGPLLVAGALGRVATALSVERRLLDFGRGVIDLSNVAFFVCGAGWLVALAVIALESRRWR